MRQPDARDAAWILALEVLATAMVGALSWLRWAAAAGVLQQAAFLGVPLLYARGAGLRPFAASGFSPLGGRAVALVLLASLGSLWPLFGLTKVETELIRVAGRGQQAQAEEKQLQQGLESARKQNPAVGILVYAVIPPLCEETFFRGLLFRGLRARFGLGVALAGTSLLFSMAHGTLVQKGMMIFLGAYFAVLVHLSGSLWAGMIAHAFNNLAVVILTWTYGAGLKDVPAPWWMLAFSAIVFGLALAGLVLERQARPAPA